jgi:chromosome segregation protein
MKLEKVVLNGFKSFADKTDFDFDADITAIVGPNGCGKSNVVDAIKWVLGEQSAKSLRSGQMADVIFSGSGSRKPMGMAEVSLFFSDIAGQIPLESDQLQISRRLYKSGESEYLINSKVCRLKDIRELFMDTGVGVRAYSIIEQGQVDQLINVSKADRRIIFEEAAGISKYKAHKKEALRKLERTEQNLLRLADIVGEVQRQLRSVKLQAGKARNYLQYTQRLKDLRVNFSLSEFHHLKNQTEEKTAVHNRLQEDFAAIVAHLANSDALVSQLSSEVLQTENEINRADNTLVATKGKIEQQFERIDFLKSRLDELEKRKTAACGQISKLQEQSSRFAAELTESETGLHTNQLLLESRNAMLEELGRVIHEIDMQTAALQADLQDEKSGIIDVVRRTAQLHNEIQSMSIYRNNLSGQKDRLSTRAAAAKAQLEQFLIEKAQQQARFGEIAQVLSQLQTNLDAKRTAIEEISHEVARDNQELVKLRETRSALQSEQCVLADMEKRHEGLNKGVKTILQQKMAGSFDYVEGILADIVSADVKYAAAVEAAFEGKADSLIISSTAKLLADKTSFEKIEGRIRFVCADRIVPFADSTDLSQYPGVLGRLVEFLRYDVKYAPLFWHILGRTLLVDSLETAIDLSGNLSDGYRFVTLAGEILDSAVSVAAGPLGKASGLISRKSRLRELEGRLAELSVQIAAMEEKLERNEQQNEHLAKLCKDLRTAVYEANTEKVEVNSKLSLLEQNVRRLSEEQPSILGEINLIEQQFDQSVKKEYESKQKLEELEEINTQRQEHIAELENRLEQQKKIQQQKAAECTDLKVAVGQIAEQCKAIKQKISSLQSQLQHSQMTIESARAELAGSGQQIDQTQRNILASESSISELFVEKEQAQHASASLHQKVEHLIDQQKQAEQEMRGYSARQAQIEQAMNQVKLELGQLQVKIEDLTQRVQEELQISIVEAYQNYQQENIDWDAVKAEISELRSKIERLGNVNVDSISEQDELEKRNDFLSSQVADLNAGKDQLQQLINRINKESREKFRATFEQVRVNFQELFRKLFGGGKADVILENPEDILECGIEIVARPPGKETRSISLLSGGEKTMTAIALLFAIFKSKPSPFCLLDEVDAALDEANNERFNLIVKEFQKTSQFVIITHSKRTMSIADVLFGVTMQQQGVSKKISVCFDQADEPASAAVA